LEPKTEENDNNNVAILLKSLRNFTREIKNFLKNHKKLDQTKKQQFFQEQISQNKTLSETLQNLNSSLPDDPKSNEIISKFLKTQKILEKIYEDFLLETQEKINEINENTEKNLVESDELVNLIQEIKGLKQNDSLNIDISLFRRILNNIEKLMNSICENTQLSKEKTQNLNYLNLLIKEASELEKQAFAFELSEIGMLRETQKKKEEIIDQYSREINEKNDYFKTLEGEIEEYRGKLAENNRKYERIMKENEKLVNEIEGLRVEMVENKENIETKTMKTQKRVEEEKNKEIMKRKEKNREMKEKIKKIEEDFLLKQEENKRLMKELKDVKINCENELKLLRNEKNVCQEENEFLKQKLDERTLQTYKSHQVNFEIFRGNVSFDSFILV